MKNIINILSLASMGMLTACSTIQPMGNIGPKQLGVYSVAHNDFLSASRMLVILDKKGNLLAYSGGTVSGAGTVGLQTAGTIATAGAVMYGASAIQKGLQNSSVNVKGIPSTIDIKTNSYFHFKPRKEV